MEWCVARGCNRQQRKVAEIEAGHRDNIGTVYTLGRGLDLPTKAVCQIQARGNLPRVLTEYSKFVKEYCCGSIGSNCARGSAASLGRSDVSKRNLLIVEWWGSARRKTPEVKTEFQLMRCFPHRKIVDQIDLPLKVPRHLASKQL